MDATTGPPCGPRRCSGSGRCLFETSIIEAIGPRLCSGQQLHADGAIERPGRQRRSRGHGRHAQSRHLLEEAPPPPARSPRAAPSRSSRGGARPGRAAPPRARSMRELLRREGRNVRRAPQQLDVRVTADDAGRGARRIDQNALVRAPVPEGRRRAQVARRRARARRRSRRRFSSMSATRSALDVERRQIDAPAPRAPADGRSCPRGLRRHRARAVRGARCSSGGGAAGRRRPAPRPALRQSPEGSLTDLPGAPK